MMSVVYVLWMYVILFAIIGMLRGWAKELLVAFSVIVALTLNHVLRKYVPVVEQLAPESTSLFWVLSLVLIASGIALIVKGDGAVVVVTVAFVSLIFGVVFTYILRREVKLPHGEGVRMFNLVKMPWHKRPPPYRMENGKVVAVEPGDEGGEPPPDREDERAATPR